jgi:WD40 repeat protein
MRACVCACQHTCLNTHSRSVALHTQARLSAQHNTTQHTPHHKHPTHTARHTRQEQALQRAFPQEPLTALAASASGAYLAAGGASGTLYIWCTASGALLRAWHAHYKAVSCLAFSDGGGVLLSGGEDTLVHSWLLAELLDARRDSGGSGAAGAAAAAAAVAGGARAEPLHTW